MSDNPASRILLIAEDPLIGSILRDQLQSLSHSVSLHASPGEGVADAQQQSFPLVIVDDQIAEATASNCFRSWRRCAPG